MQLPSGIPSHDTFNRIFAALDSLEFETCFLAWVKSVAELTEGEIISIDGKTIPRLPWQRYKISYAYGQCPGRYK
ncbi:transposase family protein [Pedobacter riviphilus]|uniref:Transposase family protein n=1 Tax=Pedobacter riviphilus TaxID=2766984 RepID=A0ABX6TFB4_9SPHI|nr:transposase family protein [Pedobacter riviphilus]